MNPADEDGPALRATRPWCLFRCGNSAYALGLESVAEVVEIERLVGLPQSPPRVLGLCTLRRDMVPVIGLERQEGPPLSERSPASRLLVLILRTPRGTWAVRINDEGTCVAEEPLDDPRPGDDDDGPVYLGTVRHDGKSYAVIDPEATWRKVRRGVEGSYSEPHGPVAAKRAIQ